MDSMFSYSKLDTYVQCKFKYKLKYVDGYNTKSDTVATEFGTLVHETEEAIANTIKAKEPINYIDLKNKFILKAYDIEHKYPEAFMTLDKSNRTYRDKVYYYLNSGIYRLERFIQEHPNYSIVSAEQPFEFNFNDNYSLHGFIDRIFKDNNTGKYLIQDIKTYAVPVEPEKLTTPLQFVVYTLAAEKLYNCKESDISCQYDLPLCDIVHDAGTANFVSRGTAKINKILTGIENGEFESSPSPLCHWCQYCQTNDDAPQDTKYLCPYYSHWTREHKDFSMENRWQGLDKHQAIFESYLKKYNISLDIIEKLDEASQEVADKNESNI